MQRALNFLQIHSTTLCFVLLILGSVIHIIAGYSHFDLSGHAWGTDDAYISYRYAQNLVLGNGLVFNPGERVEGYSNFLYVLIIVPALFFTSGFGVYIFSSLFNILCTLGAFLVFKRWICRDFSPPVKSLAAFLFAACPLVWLWTASGMETMLVLWVQLVIWAKTEQCTKPSAASKDLLILCVFLAISILSRADGFILPIITLLYLLFRHRNKELAWCGGTVFIALLSYILWRYSYYGYFLPNTYYAKVSGSLFTRIEYALQLLLVIVLSEGLLLYFIGILAVLIVKWIRIIRHQISFIEAVTFDQALLVGLLGYWIYIGGDIFHERFLLLLYPLGIYILFRSISKVFPKSVLVSFVSILTLFQLGVFVTDARFHYTLHKYDRWIVLGEYLARQHAGQTLAIDAAGKVPFISGLHTIDMFGLNDIFIAHQSVSSLDIGHNKFAPTYVLSRQPALIAAGVGPDLNLNAGMKRDLYLKAGYEVKYLVSTDKANTELIIDVSGLDTLSVESLVEKGYRYAVLQKVRDGEQVRHTRADSRLAFSFTNRSRLTYAAKRSFGEFSQH